MPVPDPAATFDADLQAATTPDDALAMLLAGNERFVAGETADRDLLAQARRTAEHGQAPYAVVLGCVDSRVPVETVLDLGIGDAFVARVAGNVVDDDVLGSLEFATAVAGSRVVLVLGHTACGAVMGACDGVELGSLTGLLARITPAVQDVAGEPTPGSDDAALVDRVVVRNVERQVMAITDRSPTIAGLVDDGSARVVGAVHDLATATVTLV